MKLLLKGIWKKHGQSWEEHLSPENEKSFPGLSIGVGSHEWDGPQKKCLSKNADVVDLHVFADASLDAICIVGYFRDQQTRELAYVVRKCRVAPMKQQSIQSPELPAAIYGTRSKQLTVDEHDVEIERTFFGRIRQVFCIQPVVCGKQSY